MCMRVCAHACVCVCVCVYSGHACESGGKGSGEMTRGNLLETLEAWSSVYVAQCINMYSVHLNNCV